jgi:hypothetical protein
MRAFEFLKEAEKPKVGRALQHAEDLVIVDGSAGAMRAVNELAKMADAVDDVTVKWDGSPAIVFGRDENGQFILTDKSGFDAKGYNGRATSGEELERMFLGRGKTEADDARRAFAANMKNVFPVFEAAVDPSVRGFFKGDLLYQAQPPLVGNTYNFTPNIVTYSIPKDSTLGKAIAQSAAGVVIHSFNDQPVKLPFKGLTGGKLMIVGPTTVNRLPQVDLAKIKELGNYVKSQAAAIDGLLDDQRLAAEKMSDFKATLYKFVNQQVDTGDLTNLNKKFDNWVANSGLSGPKKAKIQDYRADHVAGFDAVFSTLERIMQVKDGIIDQLDAADELGQNIAGQKGGEGYVKGDIKLVPRARFTAANRAKMR